MLGDERPPTFSERVYRHLLRAYPREFRDEYGAQMEQAFRDLRREEIRKGGNLWLARLWGRVLFDLGRTAIAERSKGCETETEASMSGRKLAVAGFLLLLAPLYFVSASVLKYGLGFGLMFDPIEALLYVPGRKDVFNAVSPVLFLGGLALALALNAYPVARFDFGRVEGALVGTVRLEVRLLNLVVIVLSALLLATLVGYAFLENFAPR